MKQRAIINYVLLTLLVMVSGFPLFYNNDSFIIGLLFFSSSIWIYRKRQFSKSVYLYVFIFISILIAQVINFKVFPYITFIGFLSRIFIAYFIISTLKREVFSNFINIMFIVSIISLAFYTLIVIYPPSYGLLETISIKDYSKLQHNKPLSNLIIYHLNKGGYQTNIPRNPGPFWEPGAFGGFLIIALIFLMVTKKNIFNIKGLVVIVTILTTMSTTGFLALMLLIGIYFIKIHKKVSFLLIPVYLFFTYYTYYKLDFLNAKITEKYNEIGTAENAPRDRFGSFVMDIKDFYKYPLFGRGPNSLTRYDDPSQGINNRNNGITDFLVKFGLIGFVTYFYYMLRGFEQFAVANGFKKRFSFYLLFLILVIGFSELYFMYPFFIGLSLLKEAK